MTREETKAALENLSAEASELTVRIMELNQSIFLSKCGAPTVDAMPLYQVQQFAERMLSNMQLKEQGAPLRLRLA